MIRGSLIYTDGSKGNFSFKYWKNLKDLSREDLKEIIIFKPIKKLDCEIIKFKKEFDNKGNFYFTCEVGFCESLGERGFIYPFYYDNFPTEKEIKEDIKKYIKEQIGELNSKSLGYYEEQHLKIFEKIK